MDSELTVHSPKGGKGPAGWKLWTRRRNRDIAIIVLCALSTAVQGIVAFEEGGRAWAIAVVILGAIATAAMRWRRQYPLAVTGIAGLAYVVSQVTLPMGFGLMTIAIQRRDRVLVAVTVAVAVLFILPSPYSQDSSGFDVASVIAGISGALFWALWGAYVGARRDLVASLRERAERAEAERELKTEQVRLAERARIAREMHDVLAHKVSLIALQAGGLEVNPGVDPSQVRQTAGLIRATAREALQDLRGVLGVLRDQSGADLDGSDLTPQPGLAEVAALVESSRVAGVRVSLSQDVTDAPEALGRTIYRVVREGLTNVHKHARGAATEVVIAGDASGGVWVSVVNRRPVSASMLLPGSGVGLIGLRERVALVGGTLTTGPTADGGWRVDARLLRSVDEPAPAAAAQGVP